MTKKNIFFIGNSHEKQNKGNEVMLSLNRVYNSTGPTCKTALSSEDGREEN